MDQQHTNTLHSEAAGSICERNILKVAVGTTVGGVRQILTESREPFEPLDYIYVVDGDGVLKGLAPLHQLLTREDNVVIDSFMNTEVMSVHITTDQEHIALLSLEHELKSVPVVDDGKLIGVVPSHKILRILSDEHVEDLLKEAGVVQKSLGRETGIFPQIRSRLPWLLYGMVGGLLAAGVVQRFEGALAEQLLLAAFIPTIVYLSDAVGNQVQTLYVRAYAFGLSQRLHHTLVRELSIAIVIGLVISMGLSLAAYGLFNDSLIALILLVATFSSVLFASFVAVLMPWLFMTLKKDPAVSSGPLGTIILDISSIIIYFMVAEALLAHFSA